MYGSRIISLIKKHNIKQKDLAMICDTAPANVSRWVNSEYPPLDFIVSICNHVNIPLWQFFIDDKDDFKSLRPPYMSDIDDEILRVLNTEIAENERIIIHRICRDAIQLALGASRNSFQQI